MENYFEPNLTDDQLRAISSIGLAHMGTPCSRCWCAPGSVPMARPREGGLHQATIALVRAESQAEKASGSCPF